MKTLCTVPALLLFAGCICMRQDVPLAERIVGSWRMVKAETVASTPFPVKTLGITLTTSNTFFVVAEVEKEGRRGKTKRSGTYALEGNRLAMHTTEENLDEVYTVEMRGVHLLLILPRNVTITLKRQKTKTAPNRNFY